MIEVGSRRSSLSSAICHLPSPLPIGGLLSVALSLALRLVGVTHHPVLRRPDFPPALDIRVNGARAGGRPVLLGETGILARSLREGCGLGSGTAGFCRRYAPIDAATCNDPADRVAKVYSGEDRRCGRPLKTTDLPMRMSYLSKYGLTPRVALSAKCPCRRHSASKRLRLPRVTLVTARWSTPAIACTAS
jgi:hypothetical protein